MTAKCMGYSNVYSEPEYRLSESILYYMGHTRMVHGYGLTDLGVLLAAMEK